MLDEFQAGRQDVYVFRVREGQSKGGILSGLCRLWGLPPVGSNDQKAERLHAAAKGKCLCVDEADNLSRNRQGKQVLRLIEIFRDLYEAGCGVVMVGLPSVVDDIRAAGETYIFSRIRYHVLVDAPEKTDLERVWRCMDGEAVDHRTLETIVEQAKKNGFFRFLTELGDAVSELGSIEQALPVMFKI